jgi:hypothetical protein
LRARWPAGAPLAVQTIKRVVRLGLDKDLGTALDIVASNMPIVRTSEDHQEALAAFKEKRTPHSKANEAKPPSGGYTDMTHQNTFANSCSPGALPSWALRLRPVTPATPS